MGPHGDFAGNDPHPGVFGLLDLMGNGDRRVVFQGVYTGPEYHDLDLHVLRAECHLGVVGIIKSKVEFVHAVFAHLQEHPILDLFGGETAEGEEAQAKHQQTGFLHGNVSVSIVCLRKARCVPAGVTPTEQNRIPDATTNRDNFHMRYLSYHLEMHWLKILDWRNLAR